MKSTASELAYQKEYRKREYVKAKLRRKYKDPTWISWACMIHRCNHIGHAGYDRYGGRGIKVCKAWHTFKTFLADMGLRPAGHILDRIDNEKGYLPGNCRWVTHSDSGQNKRNVHQITFSGKTQSIQMWAKELGLARNTLYQRIIVAKWPLNRALTEKTNAR